MPVPGFTAEASLGRATNQYATPAWGTSSPAAGIVAAQLPSCTVGGICFNPDVGYTCGQCPPGTSCKRRRSTYCYRVCFLWWCWTRCEASQIESYDFFCDP